MRFGYWMPVFGGWLRNSPDERMEASWDYVRRLTQRSEETGWDLTLIAELNLNDIKGRMHRRRLVDRSGAGGGDEQHRADGRGSPELPPARAVRQAGGEYRQYLQRPTFAQCGVILVGRRSDSIRAAVRRA